MWTIDPTTGKRIKNYPEFTSAKVDAVLNRAYKAFESWRTLSFDDRGLILRKAGAILRANKDQYAKLMAQEMGKPLVQGQGEIEKCAWACDFYAEQARFYLADQPVKTGASESTITHEPLGLVLAIMPWNFPFWQVFRCAAPTLMAGNVIVLKHAPSVLGCAQACENIFRETGFTPPVLSSVIVSNQNAKKIIQHPLIAAVSLTGSTRAGRSVAANAGEVLKKAVLELGGSDPYIVLEDADLEQAVETCVTSRLINGGQSCISAKRFIVAMPVFKEFEQRFVAGMQHARMGPPLHEGVALGPMARHDLRDQLHAQVQKTLRQGASLLLGGVIPEGPGAFYPPTVLTNVRPGMTAFVEELFGPAASLIKARDEEQAIRAANDTVFGLGSAIFTRDIPKARDLAKRLRAGCCFINDYVRSDVRLPFGGIKQSGYGREMAEAGIREFVNIKTVCIKRL